MSSPLPPLTISQLNARIDEASAEWGVPSARVRRMLCTLVVSQMLPDAVTVKGGMGLKLRLGEAGTRATADLDVSTTDRGVAFEEDFRIRLAQGWGQVPASKGALRRNPESPGRVAFTGTLKALPLHDPGLSRPSYVMHPYKVSLSFLGKEWAALEVEVSDPEIDPHAHHRRAIEGDLAELSRLFGFGMPAPVELIDLEYQIAQKIHAVTDPAYQRAHDLVDLQLLWNAGPDLRSIREFCLRTFSFRSTQHWPPLPLRSMDSWEAAYLESREETEISGTSVVSESLDAARTWLRSVILAIDAVGP